MPRYLTVDELGIDPLVYKGLKEFVRVAPHLKRARKVTDGQPNRKPHRFAMAAIFDPAIGQNNETPNGTLTAFQDGDSSRVFSDGVVYVMNDAGSTVAKYILNHTPVAG